MHHLNQMFQAAVLLLQMHQSCLALDVSENQALLIELNLVVFLWLCDKRICEPDVCCCFILSRHLLAAVFWAGHTETHAPSNPLCPLLSCHSFCVCFFCGCVILMWIFCNRVCAPKQPGLPCLVPFPKIRIFLATVKISCQTLSHTVRWLKKKKKIKDIKGSRICLFDTFRIAHKM